MVTFFFIAEKKPHPLAGITLQLIPITILKNIMVQGNLLDANTTYHVGTNDYLANGGDNMNFFKRIQSLILNTNSATY
jgi:hypothetical protein